jgi:hypothetical protein
MFQFPKLEHATLPSVENWYTNTNILKLPPKAVFTRRRDKVGDDLQITGWIDDSGDRICEGISKFSRGINPMVSVSYSNYNAGTNGQPLTYSNRTEAKLPYKAMDNGAFRPPILAQEDLLPLSRLPRNRVSVLTNPEFPNYLKKTENPVVHRAVKKEILQTNTRPTTYMKLDYNPCYIDESKYIKDSIIIPINSAMGGATKNGRNTVLEPLKEIVENSLKANATTQFGSALTSGLQRIADNSTFDPSRYITDTLQGNIHSNTSGYLKNIDITGFDKGVKEEVTTISYVPNAKGNEKYTLIDTEIELDRKMPIYQASTNIVDMSKQKNIRHTNDIQLEQKIMATAYTNPGVEGRGAIDIITKRDLYLRPSLQKGGFENKGFTPQVDRNESGIREFESTKSQMGRDISRMLGTRDF